MFVSFASTMLVFPVNFIIITFFRRCRPKKNAVMQINQQMPKRGKWKNVTNSSQIWGNEPRRSKWQKFKASIDNITSFHQRSKYGTQDIDPEEDEKPQPKIVGLPEEKQAKKKKKPGTFPHWCIYIAYVCKFSYQRCSCKIFNDKRLTTTSLKRTIFFKVTKDCSTIYRYL